MSDIRCPYCEYKQEEYIKDIDTGEIFKEEMSETINIFRVCDWCKDIFVLDAAFSVSFKTRKPNKLTAKTDYADSFKGDYLKCKKGGCTLTYSNKTDNFYVALDSQFREISVPADPNIWEFQEASNE